jgi:hypothetical protein
VESKQRDLQNQESHHLGQVLGLAVASQPKILNSSAIAGDSRTTRFI